MTKAISPSECFTYEQHVRFAIELKLAVRKSDDILSDLMQCYPERIYKGLPSIEHETGEIKNLLDSKVFAEHKKGDLPHNARCIYYEGLGDKIMRYEGFCFRSTKQNKGRSKPRFTKEEYMKVRARIDELNDFFRLFHSIISTTYPDSSKLIAQVKRTYLESSKFKEKLEARLKKEHGEDHEMFHEPMRRVFLQHCLTDLSNSAPAILKYSEALRRGDWETLDSLIKLFREKKAIQPTDANQPAGLQ